jgi:hypothetical protein
MKRTSPIARTALRPILEWKDESVLEVSRRERWVRRRVSEGEGKSETYLSEKDPPMSVPTIAPTERDATAHCTEEENQYSLRGEQEKCRGRTSVSTEFSS